MSMPTNHTPSKEVAANHFQSFISLIVELPVVCAVAPLQWAEKRQRLSPESTGFCKVLLRCWKGNICDKRSSSSVCVKQATVEPSIVSVLLAPSRCSTPLPRCCHIAVSFLFLTWASSSTAFTQRARVHVSLFKERSASRGRLFPMLSRTPELIRRLHVTVSSVWGCGSPAHFPQPGAIEQIPTRGRPCHSFVGFIAWPCWLMQPGLAVDTAMWRPSCVLGGPRMRGRSSVIGGGLTGMNEHCT